MPDLAYARTHVRVQADDANLMLARVLAETRHLIERNTELRLLATGAHFLVMSTALAEIYSQQNFTTMEIFTPLYDGMQGVNGQVYAQCQRLTILIARCKVWREQDPIRGQARHAGEHMFHLGERHALEREAAREQATQDVRVRVCLERVVPAVNTRDGGKSICLPADLIKTVDIARRCLSRDVEQLLAPPTPPRGRLRHCRADQLTPAAAEDPRVIDTHRLGMDQQFVQARNQ